MNFPRSASVALVVCVASAFPVLSGPQAGSASRAPAWKPVSPEELSLKAPRVEAGADAEAIFWDVRLEDSLEVTGDPRTDTWNHVRVKVFTAKGKEAFTRIDIPFEGRTRIGDLAARTIRPDGSVVEATRDAITERTIVKAGGIKVKSASVAVPAVEVGCLVEHRWREIHPDRLSYFTHLEVEREIPVETATYRFRPLDIGGWTMQTQAYFVASAPFSRDKDGYYVIELSNLGSFHEEPFMPPADTLRAWILVQYTDQKDGVSPDDFWREFGRRVAERTKGAWKPGGDVRKVAESVAGAETDPAKKLRLLFDYCRKRIRNVDAPGSTISGEERERLAKDESPSTTLSRGEGTGVAVDLAFAALANAAGLEARVARTGDRSSFLFDPKNLSAWFLRHEAVAVKAGDGWRFLAPGSPMVPFDRLPWEQEGQAALVCDPKEPRFVPVPATPVDENRTRRHARFRLSEDGTLEGEVTAELEGQPAFERRVEIAEETPDAVEKSVREEVTDRLAGAEVSAVAVEGREAPDAPLVVRYKVRVPGYATRTGSRLVFDPSFFGKGRPPLFSAAKRKQSVFFPYGFTQEDDLEFELPKGMAAEELSDPAPVRVLGGKAEYKLHLAQDGAKLVCARSFRFLGGTFDILDYRSLKRGFDRMQSEDEATVSVLRPGA